jgi:hypothetical protein
MEISTVDQLAKYKAPFGTAYGHLPVVTRREGVSSDKLHFGVSGIATWRVEMPHLQIHEMGIREKHFMHKRLVMAMVI